MGLGAAFILGLFGSLHCVGMCGPIAMALPLTAKEKSKVAFQSLLYHIGRITTYGILGLIMGLMGWGIVLAGYQKAFSIILGAALIVSALFSISLEQKLLSNTIFQRGLNWVKTNLSKSLSIKGNTSAFKIGLLNGVLPCGLVYIALAGAVSSGHLFTGATQMVAFGLGTLPMMLGVMIFGNLHKKRFFKFRKWIPIGLVLFGLFLIYRGIAVDMPADLSLWKANGLDMKCH